MDTGFLSSINPNGDPYRYSYLYNALIKFAISDG